MTDLRAAAQQAQEALDTLYRTLTPETPLAKSLKQRADDLRVALAEPDVPETDFGNMEPVAWIRDDKKLALNDGGFFSSNWTPLYTSPPQRKPLTEDKIEALFEAELLALPPYPSATKELPVRLARAIEQAHGIGSKT